MKKTILIICSSLLITISSPVHSSDIYEKLDPVRSVILEEDILPEISKVNESFLILAESDKNDKDKDHFIYLKYREGEARHNSHLIKRYFINFPTVKNLKMCDLEFGYPITPNTYGLYRGYRNSEIIDPRFVMNNCFFDFIGDIKIQTTHVIASSLYFLPRGGKIKFSSLIEECPIKSITISASDKRFPILVSGNLSLTETPDIRHLEAYNAAKIEVKMKDLGQTSS